MVTNLFELEKLYGKKIEIYFDCPRCNESFKPGSVTAQHIHIKTNENELSNNTINK